jgi:hypothetical protein
MKFLTVILSMLVMVGPLAAKAEGLPLPWPFPWAHECPVNWEDLQGRYMLEDSSDEEIELTISVIIKRGIKKAHVMRYDQYGDLVAIGTMPLGEDSRLLAVDLVPVNKQAPVMRAIIALYHESWVFSCEMQNLVPILTIQETGVQKPTTTQYKMVRRNGK